jgi:hypothetical protein
MDAIMIEVALLATLLGSQSFDTRERASLSLPPHLTIFLAHHHDPEVSHRAGYAAREHRRAWAYATAERMRASQFPRYPWIDGLHRAGDYGQCVRDYLDLVRELRQPNWCQWQEYREATRLWLRDCLLEGVPVSELQRLLDVAGEAEIQWIQANKHNKSTLPTDVDP